MGATAIPRTQYTPRLRKPVCFVDSPARIAFCANYLRGRITAMLYQHTCPVYLFIDPTDGAAYLLHEGQTSAQAWLVNHWAWFVGAYAFVHRKGMPMLRPTREGIAEDIGNHLGFPLI